MNKNNKLIIYISSAMVAIALIVITVLLIHAYNQNKRAQVIETYGIVKKVNNDSIIVEEANTNKEMTFIKDGGSAYKEGDLVLVKSKDNVIESYQVIVDNYDDILTPSITTTTVPTTTTTTTSTTSTTTSTSRAQTPTSNVTTTTTKKVDKDQSIIDYLSDEYEKVKSGEVTSTFKEKAKNAFVSIVDFIFYDGEIKGVKFSELKAATKAKVIYYALLIDAGIESKFPDYKAHLSSKYNDIKAKLIAEFLEIKYFVCSKSGDDCEQVKADFAILKNALNLTWDAVKAAFTYIKDLSVPKIKSWYEAFRG